MGLARSLQHHLDGLCQSLKRERFRNVVDRSKRTRGLGHQRIGFSRDNHYRHGKRLSTQAVEDLKSGHVWKVQIKQHQIWGL